MFFFFAVTDDRRSLGFHQCRGFSCCHRFDGSVEVICVSRKFIFFFLPLFRFGKRYFVTCPGCGSVFEISPAEGKRLERSPGAEIDPAALRKVSQGNGERICPGCGARVQSDASFCPYCGRRL